MSRAQVPFQTACSRRSSNLVRALKSSHAHTELACVQMRMASMSQRPTCPETSRLSCVQSGLRTMIDIVHSCNGSLNSSVHLLRGIRHSKNQSRVPSELQDLTPLRCNKKLNAPHRCLLCWPLRPHASTCLSLRRFERQRATNASTPRLCSQWRLPYWLKAWHTSSIRR